MKFRNIPSISQSEYDSLLVNTISNGDCIIWQGAKTYKGYGTTAITGLSLLVTRLILSHNTGKDGIGLLACHTCDVPSCINPKHLFWGTHSDNTRDCVAKGRWVNPSKSAEKTICKHGHSLGPDNLYPTKNGKKACKECVRRRSNETYRRKLLKLKQLPI